MWKLDNPQALILLTLPIALLLYLLLKRRATRGNFLLPLSTLNPELKRMTRKTRNRMRLIFGLPMLSLLLLVLVMAEPVFIQFRTERKSSGIDIVLAVDVSESMEATDFLPNRMVVSQKVIRDFIRRRTEDRIGLVIFGGEAVSKVPLTTDFDFLLEQVDNLKMRELKQGTAIGMGLLSAVNRLRQSTAKSKVVVLLTDGDNNVGAVNPTTAAHLAKQEGIKVYTIGIGKKDRVLVPIYAYDMDGNKTQLITQVPSYLNPELLKEVALTTGGKTYLARDPAMLTDILREIDAQEKTMVRVKTKTEIQDVYFWPAVAAMFLLFMFHLLMNTIGRQGKIVFSV